MSRVLLLIALCLVIIQCVSSLSIVLRAHEKECFFEELEVGEKVTMSYQVAEDDKNGIDFWLQDPSGAYVISTTRVNSNSHSLQANSEGKYTYCFSNEFSSDEKKVGFNIHENFQKIHDNIKAHTDPLEKEIAELAESIFAVKAQQEYIVVRERQHRDTAESTNSRVKWWSIAQVGLLVSVCLWQVYYLKRFFEVKRAV